MFEKLPISSRNQPPLRQLSREVGQSVRVFVPVIHLRLASHDPRWIPRFGRNAHHSQVSFQQILERN